MQRTPSLAAPGSALIRPLAFGPAHEFVDDLHELPGAAGKARGAQVLAVHDDGRYAAYAISGHQLAAVRDFRLDLLRAVDLGELVCVDAVLSHPIEHHLFLVDRFSVEMEVVVYEPVQAADVARRFQRVVELPERLPAFR